MATTVSELELSTPLPAIELPPHSSGLLALLRWHGRPFGLLRIAATGRLEPQQLREAIAAQVVPPLPTDLSAVPAAAETPPPVSIIVCTHERPDDLRRCLDSLLPAAEAGHEVLIVDNAPRTEQTAALAARYPFRYMIEPRIGLNHARNCGLRAASHPIVAYTDDDAVVDPAWVAAIARPFAAPEVGCVTGLVLPLELETLAQEQFETYCFHRRDFTRRVFTPTDTPPAMAGIAGMGANMALRAELALRLGGFDPRLDAGTATCSGGDTDMYARVLEAGTTIVYTPDALVWHRHRRTQAELDRCIFGYGVGAHSFLTKRFVETGEWYAPVAAGRWLVGPFVKAAARRLRGQPAVPLRLLLHEARGSLLAPLRFWQATRHLRQSEYPANEQHQTETRKTHV